MLPKDLLIIVPARGGSKGLPRKNIKILGKLPLIGWAAEAVRRSGLHEATCILSTDDEEIASVGVSVGLEVPFMRPAHLSGDEVIMEAVALHALDWLAQNNVFFAKAVMILQPTSPFRPPNSLAQAVTMLKDPSIDGVLSVQPMYKNLATLFYMNEQLNLIPLDDKIERIPQRQKVQPIYTPNGALYLVRAEKLNDPRGFFPLKSRGIVMDQIASIDIDDVIDWQIAEAMVSNKLTWGS